MLWIMPIHVAVRALLGKRSLQRLAAVRTWRGSADRIRSARMQNPNLGPGDGTKRQRPELVHGHHVLILTNQLPDPCFIILGKVGKLRNRNTALRTLGTASRQGANDE